MKVGDIVTRSDGQVLRSGGEAYMEAIVIKTRPLVLVSHGTDMRWESTVRDVAFTVIGPASTAALARCSRRMDN